MTLAMREQELIDKGRYAEFLALALQETADLEVATLAADMAFAAEEWQPYQGAGGGRGWKNAGTGEVRYQTERPDSSGIAPQQPAAAEQNLQQQIAQQIQGMTAEELQQVAQFLSKMRGAAQGPEQGPAQGPAQAKPPKQKPELANPEAVKQISANVKVLAKASLNPEVEYHQIDSLVTKMLAPMAVQDALAVASSFGTSQARSKKQAIEEIVRRIKDRKGSWDRTGFRERTLPEEAVAALAELKKILASFSLEPEGAEPPAIVTDETIAAQGSGSGTFTQQDPDAKPLGKNDRGKKGAKKTTRSRKMKRGLRLRKKWLSQKKGIFFAADPAQWHEHKTHSGKPGWKNQVTGEVRYQQLRPGSARAGKAAKETPASSAPSSALPAPSPSPSPPTPAAPSSSPTPTQSAPAPAALPAYEPLAPVSLESEMQATADYPHWFQNLSPRAQEALDTYKGLGFQGLNVQLRAAGGDANRLDPEQLSKVEGMDEAIASSPGLSAPAYLYRAIRKGVLPGDVAIGTEIKDYGYVSTSFSEWYGQPGNYALGDSFVIHAPAGTKGARSAPAYNTQGEREFILPRNSTLRVKKIDQTDLGRVIHADVI